MKNFQFWVAFCVVVVASVSAVSVHTKNPLDKPTSPLAYDYCQAPGVVASVNTTGKTLQLVQIIVRHGDRSPINLLPPGFNAPWSCPLTTLQMSIDNDDSAITPQRLFKKNYLPNRQPYGGNCFLGQLTEKGLQQHVSLGQQFRQLYVDTYHFLPEQMNMSTIWIRSTDIPRTIQSAMGNFLGLYPPETRSDGEVNVVPVNTMDISMEDMVQNAALCPRVVQLLQQATQSSQWQQFVAKMVPLRAKLQQIFNSTQLGDFTDLLDSFHALQCHGKPYPPGLTDDIANQVYAAAQWEVTYLWNDPQLALLSMGPFLQEIYSRMLSFVSGQSTMPNYLFYSAHDTTVGPFVANLGLFDGNWPPYASHVELELWSDANNQYYVQVKYNGQVKQVSGCDNAMCSFEQFQQFALTRIPTDYAQQCTPQ